MGRIDPSHDCGPRFFKPSEKSARVHRHSVDSMRARLADRRPAATTDLAPVRHLRAQHPARDLSRARPRRDRRAAGRIRGLQPDARGRAADAVGARRDARHAALDDVDLPRAMLGRGDAKRIPNPSDGRSVRVVLTDRGRGVVRTVNPPFTRALVALEANLDAPVGDVRAVLRDILEAIERADAQLDVGAPGHQGRYYELVVSCGHTQAEGAMGRARTRIAVAVLIGWLVAACGTTPLGQPVGVRARPRRLRSRRRPRKSRRPSRPPRRAPRTWPRRATPTSTTSSSA